MAAQPSVADSKHPQRADGARRQIETLVQERMVGRKIDGVGFMDELLAIATHVGELSCRLAADQGLRFELRDSEPFEVDVDRNRGKLRMLCARLAVLCQESGTEFLLYGGEGSIRNAWKARWMNTPGEHWFTIVAE